MNRNFKLPDDETIDLARSSAAVLSRHLQKLPDERRALVKMGGEDLILPRAAVELLCDILSGMSAGKAISIVPKSAELTTQLAADFLNVSRPYLVGLLEQRRLPFIKVGTHRRVKLEDLMKYKEEMMAASKSAMDRIVELSQDLDMGY